MNETVLSFDNNASNNFFIFSSSSFFFWYSSRNETDSYLTWNRWTMLQTGIYFVKTAWSRFSQKDDWNNIFHPRKRNGNELIMPCQRTFGAISLRFSDSELTLPLLNNASNSLFVLESKKRRRMVDKHCRCEKMGWLFRLLILTQREGKQRKGRKRENVRIIFHPLLFLVCYYLSQFYSDFLLLYARKEIERGLI